jgi:inner membrane protein
MDTLTHALSGALLARATAPRGAAPWALPLRGRVLAGAAAAVFPDIDYVVGFVSPIAYLQTHRGVTHSLLLLPAWALLLAWIASRMARDPRGHGPWFAVCALGIAVHIAGDLITSFGTMILAPVSDARFALGTTFIIDLVFTGIIVAGLAASLAWRGSRLPAVAATLVLGGYVAFQALAKAEAERVGERYAREAGLADATVQAQPRPVSPLNWTVFVSRPDEIRYAHLNLRRRDVKTLAPDAGFLARLDAAYRPVADAQWTTRARFGTTMEERALAKSAWNASELRFFRWFAELPVQDGISGSSTCVWFRDLRFETPGRPTVPFRYGVCRDGPDDRWHLSANGENAAPRGSAP